MKVLVNAVSIKEGGSLVVLDRLVGAMSRLNPGIAWHVIVDAAHTNLFSGNDRVTAYSYPWVGRSPAGLAYFYEIVLPRLAARIDPKVVFSQTNYLPRRRLPQPTVLLIQHAGHFSPEFARLTEMAAGNQLGKLAWRYKTNWVHASARAASLVTVQTAALASAITEQIRVPPGRIRVIPHGPGLLDVATRARGPARPTQWRIGYITKFGVQKNFPIMLRALARLRGWGLPAKLVLTLGGKAGSPESFDALRPLINELGIADAVEHHGELSWDRVRDLYDTLDFFVFPSFCEFFGFPMVEAMARALPILVADTPGNREVAGAGVQAFARDDDETLASQLRALMDDPQAYARQSARSVEQARRYSWDAAASATLEAIQELQPQYAGRGRFPQAVERAVAVKGHHRPPLEHT